MPHSPIHQRLVFIIEPVCIDAGCELVDVRLVMDQGGWVLRVCIDRPLPEGADLTVVHEERVDLSECERVSRLLSAVLDVDDPVAQAYSLEVSSPGIDRPLRTAAHFERYAGAEAKIQLHAPMPTPTGGERRNFRGVLRGVREAHVAIEVDGTTYTLPLDDIDAARLVPDWDDVMRGGSGVSFPSASPPAGSSKGGAARRKGARKQQGETAAQSAGHARGEAASADAEQPEAGSEDYEAHNAPLNNSPDVPVPDNR